MPNPDPTIMLKRLEPSLWRDLEKLFGSNGACGGCWCMHWRTLKGEKWADVKGAPAKARFRRLVQSGKARGVLAYVNGEPAGWCAYGPRPDFDKLNRAPSLACSDAAQVWSLPCFFIRREFRNQGLAGRLLAFALECLKAEGAMIAEGYPVRAQPGAALPAAFAWTGLHGMFEKAGFVVADARTKGKQRMRKRLT